MPDGRPALDVGLALVSLARRMNKAPAHTRHSLLATATDCSCRHAKDLKKSDIDRIAPPRIVNYI